MDINVVTEVPFSSLKQGDRVKAINGVNGTIRSTNTTQDPFLGEVVQMVTILWLDNEGGNRRYPYDLLRNVEWVGHALKEDSFNENGPQVGDTVTFFVDGKEHSSEVLPAGVSIKVPNPENFTRSNTPWFIMGYSEESRTVDSDSVPVGLKFILDAEMLDLNLTDVDTQFTFMVDDIVIIADVHPDFDKSRDDVFDCVDETVKFHLVVGDDYKLIVTDVDTNIKR